MADSTKHLLLVEDEAPLREAVAEQLTDHGFEVVQADSAGARASSDWRILRSTS